MRVRDEGRSGRSGMTFAAAKPRRHCPFAGRRQRLLSPLIPGIGTPATIGQSSKLRPQLVRAQELSAVGWQGQEGEPRRHEVDSTQFSPRSNRLPLLRSPCRVTGRAPYFLSTATPFSGWWWQDPGLLSRPRCSPRNVCFHANIRCRPDSLHANRLRVSQAKEKSPRLTTRAFPCETLARRILLSALKIAYIMPSSQAYILPLNFFLPVSPFCRPAVGRGSSRRGWASG